MFGIIILAISTLQSKAEILSLEEQSFFSLLRPGSGLKGYLHRMMPPFHQLNMHPSSKFLGT